MSVRSSIRWATLVASVVGLMHENGLALRSAEGREPAIRRVTTIRAGLLSHQPETKNHTPTHLAQWYNWGNWGNWGGRVPRRAGRWWWPGR